MKDKRNLPPPEKVNAGRYIEDGNCWVSDMTGDEINAILDAYACGELVPVVHGRWITSGKEVCGDRQYFCSACNKEYWETQSWPKRANYCPNCGADMRGENRE